jgi:hypothetical protein
MRFGCWVGSIALVGAMSAAIVSARAEDFSTADEVIEQGRPKPLVGTFCRLVAAQRCVGRQARNPTPGGHGPPCLRHRRSAAPWQHFCF